MHNRVTKRICAISRVTSSWSGAVSLMATTSRRGPAL
jgi:hypothetical protein